MKKQLIYSKHLPHDVLHLKWVVETYANRCISHVTVLFKDISGRITLGGNYVGPAELHFIYDLVDLHHREKVLRVFDVFSVEQLGAGPHKRLAFPRGNDEWLKRSSFGD